MAGKRAQTQKKLIEAAIGLFSKNGFAQTTFQDIATEAGVTQPLLYTYFKDKMDIFCSCVLYVAEIGRGKIYHNLDSQKAADKVLKQYLLNNLLWFEQNDEYAHTLLGLYYFAGSNSKVRDIFLQTQELAINKIYEILKRGKKEKVWNGNNLALTAQMIHSILVGELYKQFYSDTKIPSARKRAQNLYYAALKLV